MESADQPEARPRVLQLRVVIEAGDYDEAVRFFRDVLGLPTMLAYEDPDDDRVVILEAGQATLEIGTPAHSRVIDRLEGATESSPGIRLAIEVTDAAATCAAAQSAGTAVVGPLVTTPWGSLNARVLGPAATHLTLFQQLESGPERDPSTS